MDKYMKLKDIPKGQRWEHFWTYYKVQTIIGAFVVLLVAMLVKDVVFKEKVDIYLTVASSEYASDAVSAELSRVLQQYGEDFDGNGDLSVYVDQITMSTESYTVDPEMVMAAQTRLIAQFQDKNQIIFLMDQDIYDYLNYDEEGEDTAIFANLADTVGGSVTPLLGEETDKLYLKDIPAYQENELLQQLPQEMFFVMRREQDVNPKGDEEIAEIYQRSVKMMENLASGTVSELAASAQES